MNFRISFSIYAESTSWHLLLLPDHSVFFSPRSQVPPDMFLLTWIIYKVDGEFFSVVRVSFNSTVKWKMEGLNLLGLNSPSMNEGVGKACGLTSQRTCPPLLPSTVITGCALSLVVVFFSPHLFSPCICAVTWTRSFLRFHRLFKRLRSHEELAFWENLLFQELMAFLLLKVISNHRSTQFDLLLRCLQAWCVCFYENVH